jgi:ferrochelatase
MAQPKTAVVLFQLGGPDSLEAVEPFLYNLFCDPDIINFPGAFVARRPLAKLISTRRHKKVAAHYAEIGGKSPILELTNRQAAALEAELNKEMPARVFVAMRYWHPYTEEVIEELKKERYGNIVLLPLYPQYSKATTVSSMKEWNRQCQILGYSGVATSSVCCYYNHPLYIEAIADNVDETYARFSGIHPHEIDVIFSAHGIPVSLVNEGDPYQRQIEETVRLVAQKGGWISPHHLCYQSKVGPAQWLHPSLHETLQLLALRKRKYALIIPIAFVTEHIETLHEINIETRESAGKLGFEKFEMMPALNDSAKFIRCLADLVRKKTAAAPLGLASCKSLFEKDPGRIAPTLCPYWLQGR